MKSDRIELNFSSLIVILIFVLFFIAKILNLIDWPWWLVFSPLCIPPLMLLILIILIILIRFLS